MDIDHMDKDDNMTLLKKCKETVSCSWTIFSIRRESNKKWVTLIIYFDEDTREPFFCVEITDETELTAFVARLLKTKRLTDEMREETGL